MILYKYLTADRVDVLLNCMVRYTQPKAFNDPFEVKPYVCKISEDQIAYSMFEELVSKKLQEIYDKLPGEFRTNMPFAIFCTTVQEELGPKAKVLFHQLIESNTPMIRKMIDEEFNDRIGIFSLAEKRDNLLMWAHYAASYEGFVIGFDSEHPCFNNKKGPNDEFCHLRRVEYRETRVASPLIELSGIDTLFVKSTQWSYEQEWRIIQPLQDADIINANQPYTIYLFKFPASAIREVIFGCRMKDSKRLAILESLKSDIFQHVKIFQAEPDKIEFKLNIRQAVS